MKVLVIEDDRRTVENVSLAFHVRWPDAKLIYCGDGKKGVERARGESPDLIIIDSVLPDMDGLEVLEQIRRDSKVPILILTSLRDETELVKSLERGADECMVKPFGQMELLARVNNLTRRRQ